MKHLNPSLFSSLTFSQNILIVYKCIGLLGVNKGLKIIQQVGTLIRKRWKKINLSLIKTVN